MLACFARIPLARAMILAVGAALVVMQVPPFVYDLAVERREIEAQAEQRADAALDMVEGLHAQTMLNRALIESGGLIMPSVDGSMKQLARASRSLRLWVFMGPRLLAFQTDNRADRRDGPRDAVDEAAIVAGQRQRALVDGVLRVSRPVLLETGSGVDPRCAACHGRLMGIGPGEVVGGYSAAVDLRAELARWRSGAIRHGLVAATTLVLTLVLISVLLHFTALGPLRRLATSTRRLAQGEVEAELEGSDRPDELGAMARSLEVFRGNLVARARLERESAAARSEARYLASHDPLTGLPNRGLFAERLEGAIAVARRQADAVAVLCLDLDRFKEVNDVLGHAAGDELLKKVAARLRACLRETDTAARLGADEFAIVQVGPVRPADAEALCSRLFDLFEAPLRVAGQDVVVGLSIGVSIGPDEGETADLLLKQADIAMCRAKAEGGPGYRFFEPHMNTALEMRKALEQDLRGAAARDEFQLHYQPALDVASGRIVGVEALLRWRHPTRGQVSPADFIPVAEATGLIMPIGKWVLRTACAQAVRWPELTMAVNLSPAQFRHPDLAGLIRAILEETGLPAPRLEVEITEGVLLDDVDGAVRTLDALKLLGVRIAMDDFGTGYSSLSYLQRFPFDKLKIDQSFVRDLGRSDHAGAIVRSVVSLGRSLGITTTAEGVETAMQLAFLEREGCDQAQGYHLGRPVPAAEIDRMLHGKGASGSHSHALRPLSEPALVHP